MTDHYGMRPAAYTTDGNGNIAVPGGSWPSYANALPVTLGAARVRALAIEVADAITQAARTETGPVVWITGNSYVPPLRSVTQAEYVWNAANNDDGELWAWFAEMVEGTLSDNMVALECPDYDNALYAVDLARWQYRGDEQTDADDIENDDINGLWEPRDPDAVDDNAENPRE